MKYILVNDSSGQMEDFIQFEANNLTEARAKSADLLAKKDQTKQFNLYERIDSEGRQLELPMTFTRELVIPSVVLENKIITTEVPVANTTKEKKKKPLAEAPTASEVIQDPVMLDAAQAAAETLVDEVK